MTTDADWDSSTRSSRASARAARPDWTRPNVAVRVPERTPRFRDSGWAALVASAVILLITALAAFAGSTTM
jgi:hypothetical protein